MVKELYQIRTREISLNITNGEIDAVRRKNLVKSGCRVYENGCIGVAGTLGEPTEETWQAAQQALSAEIPYPDMPAGQLVRSRTLGLMPEEKTFIAQMEQVLATLKREFPEFILSNKISACEETRILKNDCGLYLNDTRCMISAEIVAKEEASANVFDTDILWESQELDPERLLANAREILTAHLRSVPLPEQPVPVLMTDELLIRKLGEYLDTRKLKKNASLLSGREGETVFSEKFSVCAQRDADSRQPFFDAEGTVLPDGRLPLIENGVLVRGTADKLCAEEFGAELTAAAGGDYDDVPTLQSACLRVVPNAPLSELLHGRDAVCIMIASGGDVTPEGDFATPVQAAYLCRDGKLVGRVPEFQFRGNVFELLGKHYLGYSTDRTAAGERVLVVQGQIDL